MRFLLGIVWLWTQAAWAWPEMGWPALSLSVQVGQASVAGVNARALELQVESDGDWRKWSLTLSAPELTVHGRRLREVRAEGVLQERAAGWQLAEARAWARFADARLALAGSEVPLSRLFAGELDLPPGMRLSLREEGGAFAAEFGGLHGKAQARVSGKQVRAWLAAAGVPLAEMQGLAIAEVSLARQGQRWQVEGNARLEGATWGSSDGLYALDKGAGRLTFSAAGAGERWAGRFALALEGGEALLSPLYFHLGETPLSLSGAWQLESGRLRLREVVFSEREAHGELEASVHWPSLALEGVRVLRASGDAQAIYRRYVRPFVRDTLFADVALRGTLFASLDWQQGTLREASAVFNQVDVVDNGGRFALYGLDGQLGKGGVSRLRSARSLWRKLPLSGWQAEFVWDEEGVHLLAPLSVEVLGGALRIERLEPVGKRDYRLDVRLLPLDLRQLAEALDWPPFDGEVSGEFRQVHFNSEGLRLQEPVFANIFGGRVAVRDLRVEQFFSAHPLYYFSLDIDKMDLQTLTRVMQVAEIQGNISGVVKDVQVRQGEVRRFVADIHTSPDDPGKRSISHEAVQYLSQAGGGSAMVGEFVRVLNAFPYARLGFAARLENNVLEITGVEEAANGGYYLVKGRGLPHLDIVGFERRVDWPELLRRLDAARHTDAAVVE